MTQGFSRTHHHTVYVLYERWLQMFRERGADLSRSLYMKAINNKGIGDRNIEKQRTGH